MKKKVKFQQPEPFKPTQNEELETMNEVAKFLSKDKVIQSIQYPELKVPGTL